MHHSPPSSQSGRKTRPRPAPAPSAPTRPPPHSDDPRTHLGRTRKRPPSTTQALPLEQGERHATAPRRSPEVRGSRTPHPAIPLVPPEFPTHRHPSTAQAAHRTARLGQVGGRTSAPQQAPPRPTRWRFPPSMTILPGGRPTRRPPDTGRAIPPPSLGQGERHPTAAQRPSPPPTQRRFPPPITILPGGLPPQGSLHHADAPSFAPSQSGRATRHHAAAATQGRRGCLPLSIGRCTPGASHPMAPTPPRGPPPRTTHLEQAGRCATIPQQPPPSPTRLPSSLH